MEPSQLNERLAGMVAAGSSIFTGEAKSSSGFLLTPTESSLGGGRKGIGKSSFLAAYHGRNVSEIQWPDGITNSAIVIGNIHDGDLATKISEFIRAVEQYKQAFSRSS
jgi:hypothetical protein